jgi:hypothetical protein
VLVSGSAKREKLILVSISAAAGSLAEKTRGTMEIVNPVICLPLGGVLVILKAVIRITRNYYRISSGHIIAFIGLLLPRQI